MEFQDFPMFLEKSGKYEINPPKLCAGILPRELAAASREAQQRTVPDRGERRPRAGLEP